MFPPDLVRQAEIKDKHERLARDQAEYETHLSMVTDRASKREADLRQSLQVRFSTLFNSNLGFYAVHSP